MDQFLDDLFMPVLDGNIDDGLSDARSLAASMRGNDDSDSEVTSMLEFKRIGSIRRRSLLPQVSGDGDEELLCLSRVSQLVTRIQGGGSPSPSQNSPRKTSDFTPMTSSAMGFHPIPGVISPHPVSGMISPPLIMPTPIQVRQCTVQGQTSQTCTSGLLSPTDHCVIDRSVPSLFVQHSI